ncbi:hypothetical protein ACFQZX_07160 [Mucilaginibacter litoreus]|uniref:Uncharacterized protein n=1 Tax=Mucilaginibacter litoreus TaxID=1048221 RepID=A0ABW3AR83_9SPHI
MNMQDKEIDRLFRSELEHFEAAPSPEVWKNISAELGSQTTKRPFLRYMGIAASLLIILSAGWYFITDTKPPVKNRTNIARVNVKKNEAKPEAEPAKQQLAVKLPAQPENEIHQDVQVASVKAFRKVKVKKPVPAQNTANIEPVLPASQIAQNTPKPDTGSIKYVVPDKETPLIARMEAPEDIKFSTSLMPVAAQEQPVAKTIAAAPVKKHRIRGIGDLLNAVVRKIDKRKDKLIEFSDKDEDEPNITGINLGFLKIKKQD